jgi:hypothetical protein
MGYTVYYGTSSGSYGFQVNIGKDMTTYAVTGLTEGLLYYFAITAYDTMGNESEFSNEVDKIAGAGGGAPPPVPPPGGAAVSGGGCGWVRNTAPGQGPRFAQGILNLAILALPLALVRVKRLLVAIKASSGGKEVIA